ncbi:MAG: methyl-accepting chemotaxis protein [Magnetovibrionaceae bacterium]
MNANLKARAVAGCIISLAAVIFLGVCASSVTLKLDATLTEGTVDVERVSQQVAPLVLKSTQIQLDLIRARAWYAEAAVKAAVGEVPFDSSNQMKAVLLKDLAEVKELASALDLAGVLGSLSDVERMVPGLFEQGHRVLEAYEAGGLASGLDRKLRFDELAAQLDSQLHSLAEEVDAYRARVSEETVLAFEDAVGFADVALWLMITLAVLAISISIIISLKTVGIASIITTASAVLDQAAKGELGIRVTNIKADHETEHLQSNINRMLDYTEAFSREVGAAMQAINQGSYFRRIIEDGKPGSYLQNSRRINSAIAAMENDGKNEAVIKAELRELVSQAAAGDFSGRLSVEDKQDFYRDLAEGLNTIFETVEQALDETAGVLQSFSVGDLEARMSEDYQGAFARLADSSNTMADKLAEIVGEITQAATAVQDATSEIAAGTDDLALRTEEQAADLEKTASAMEELTATVRQNADAAAEVSAISSEAREQAEKGGQTVGEAVEAMGLISESSGKISEIVDMIEEIAFQTNLLALNAAVEAARAGEAGKGFAVVAAEVRALAQRSSEASKEISGLINTSSRQVQDGVLLVNKTGETLAGILTAVAKVADRVSEISAASQEQAIGLDDINTAISKMEEITQQNAALVEQATAAAQSLEDQAVGLSDQVAFFGAGEQET